MEPSVRAYMLADKVNALMASDMIHQKTMAMDPMEYRDFLAVEMDRVLNSRPVATKAPPFDVHPSEEPSPPKSTITDTIARQTLENAPEDVRSAYRNGRREGLTPAEAMEAAMEIFRRMQEALADISG